MNYKLYASCIPTRGIKRSILCDLQKHQYSYIPNSLCEILCNNPIIDFENLLQIYGKENEDTIIEYKDYLLSNEYIFTDSYLERFPSMKLNWNHPSPITNVIVEISEPLQYNIDTIIKELNELGVIHIELRLFNLVDFKFLKNIIKKLDGSSLQSIVLYVNDEIGINETDLIQLLQVHKRIETLYLYNTVNVGKTTYVPESGSSIHYLSESIIDARHCGKILHSLFQINVAHFTEAQEHNTCLNRKLSISADGNIKNCPSMTKVFGNVKNNSLRELIEKRDFKELWSLSKDKISVCKNCEYRYICTDCRAYLEDPQNIYSKPLKCGYNPETCVWEDWSFNPLKSSAIEYYGLHDF